MKETWTGVTVQPSRNPSQQLLSVVVGIGGNRKCALICTRIHVASVITSYSCTCACTWAFISFMSFVQSAHRDAGILFYCTVGTTIHWLSTDNYNMIARRVNIFKAVFFRPFFNFVTVRTWWIVFLCIYFCFTTCFVLLAVHVRIPNPSAELFWFV